MSNYKRKLRSIESKPTECLQQKHIFRVILTICFGDVRNILFIFKRDNDAYVGNLFTKKSCLERIWTIQVKNKLTRVFIKMDRHFKNI